MDMMPMIKAMSATVAQRVKAEEGDYIVDGLLYCHKCGTPKQTRITINGEAITPYCLCECQVKELDREDERRRKAEEMQRIEKLRKAGFRDKEMQGWTFENDDHKNERISKIAQNYVENWPKLLKDGKGLLLFGGVGTGKTYIAACIANALIDKGFPCLMTNFSRLVNTIQDMKEGRQSYIDKLNRFPLLVIDDLASERDTEYMGEIVQSVIDARYRAGLPLIVTTNLTSEELKRPADMKKQRLYSRLFEMCIPLEVKGVDRRKAKLKEDFKEYNELLGIIP